MRTVAQLRIAEALSIFHPTTSTMAIRIVSNLGIRSQTEVIVIVAMDMG
jgi:hypothetical protein